MTVLAQITGWVRNTLLGIVPDAFDSSIAGAPDWALLCGTVFLVLLIGWTLFAGYRAVSRPRLLAYAPRRTKAASRDTVQPSPRPQGSGFAARMQAKLLELTASTTPQKPPTPAQLKQLKEDEQKLVAAAAADGAPADVFRELGAFRGPHNVAGAIQAFEAARALDSTDFWTHAFLARLYEKAGRAEEAQEANVTAIRAAATAWQLMEFEDQVLSADETLEQLEAAKRSLANAPKTLEEVVKASSKEEAREFTQLAGLLLSLGARFVHRDLRTGAAALEWSRCLAEGLSQTDSREEVVQLAQDKYVRERLAHLSSFEELEPLAAALVARLDELAGTGSSSSSAA